MRTSIDRRHFLSTGAVSLATLAIGAAPEKATGKKPPMVIAATNGKSTVEKVMERIKAGADPLDAIIEGVSAVESDPNDPSIGIGGIPNAEGVVEMDAAVMHGPTHGAGAVAALRNILHPAAVARAVMQRTNNCLVVGEGALKFAKENGFPEADLLTDETRKLWEAWKKVSEADKAGAAPDPADIKTISDAMAKHSWTGSMLCAALDTHGDLAGLSVTPGGSFKIPGRVGDTPIIGAGLYVDNEVGACFSTGTGEMNIMNCGSYLVVENLRRGLSPKAACLDACKRVARSSRRNPRFRDDRGRLAGGVVYYCLAKDGRFGGASMGRPMKMIVHDGEKVGMVELPAYLT